MATKKSGGGATKSTKKSGGGAKRKTGSPGDRFRNSIMNADKANVRPDMDEVASGWGYANSHGRTGNPAVNPHTGRNLTTGNWENAHKAGKKAYEASAQKYAKKTQKSSGGTKKKGK